MTPKQTLPREAEEFLANLLALSLTTKSLYRHVLAHLFQFIQKPPGVLDIQDVRRFLNHLGRDHAYSQNTLRTYINVLRSFLRYIKREDLRAQIKAIRPSKTLPKVPTPEEVQRMIDAAPTLRDKMIVQTLARSGMRVGELCNVHIKDIDLENRRIVVRRKDGWKPKGGRERIVRIDSETALLIQKHIESRSEGPLIDITPSLVRTVIKRAAQRAGIKSAHHITPHRLRHFFPAISFREAVT